jgi:hypothetical protein
VSGGSAHPDSLYISRVLQTPALCDAVAGSDIRHFEAILCHTMLYCGIWCSTVLYLLQAVLSDIFEAVVSQELFAKYRRYAVCTYPVVPRS